MPSLRHLLPAALLTLLTLLTLLSLPPLLSLLHLAAGLSFSLHMGWPPLPCFPPLISPTPSFLDVARRRRRRSYSLVRTRLLRPAPPSEADRGCARSVPGRKDAGKPDGACAGHRPRLRLPERRHVRVPPRSSSSLHPAPCILHPAPCTMYPTRTSCTLHTPPAPCTLHLAGTCEFLLPGSASGGASGGGGGGGAAPVFLEFNPRIQVGSAVPSP